MSKLSTCIRSGLAQRGLSQSHLAKALGVSENTVSRWVQSQNLPDKESLFELSSFFGWSDHRVNLILEDWFENESGERRYKIAGPAYVEFRFEGDYVEFQRFLIDLDINNISGLPHEFEGTPEQWAPIFEASLNTWKLVVLNNEIVGYWYFICPKERYYNQIVSGGILDKDITLEMIEVPLVPKDYCCYFAAINISALHRNTEVFSVLLSSMNDEFVRFTKSGVYFSKICAFSLSHLGKRLCDDFGMHSLGLHPNSTDDLNAEIYEITGDKIAQSYFGRNPVVRQGYLQRYE